MGPLAFLSIPKVSPSCAECHRNHAPDADRTAHRQRPRAFSCIAGKCASDLFLTADHAGRTSLRPWPARRPDAEMPAPYRLGHWHRRGHRAPVRHVGRDRCPADLFAPGHRLQSRSRLALRHARNQRLHAHSRQYGPIPQDRRCPRVAAIFTPYHTRIASLLDARNGARRRTGYLSPCTASRRASKVKAARCRSACSTTRIRPWPASCSTYCVRNPT